MAKRKREALPGGLTLRDLEQRLRSELQEKFTPGDKQYLYLRDLTDEWVIYELEGAGVTAPGCYKVTYSIDGENKMTLGEPVEVQQRTVYETATESIPGRVLEAKADAADGGRVFAVQIVAYGDSKNGRRYTESVMRKAVPLYEGTGAYDHHRSDQELKSSTITGLVGYYRGVTAGKESLEADLYLLPSATHVAEALDASLATQADGLEPLVGISHDVMASYRPLVADGKRLHEATEIVAVNSADVVAKPAAGGRATRMVAGGAGDAEEEEDMDIEKLLELLNGATPEQKQQIATATALNGGGAPAATGAATDDDAAAAAAAAGAAAGEEGAAAKLVGAAAEASYGRASAVGRMVIRSAVTEAELDPRLLEAVTKLVPDRFTEADLTHAVESIKSLGGVIRGIEAEGLSPTVTARVTGEDRDKKIAAVDAMLAGDYKKGYRSFKEAFIDVTGTRQVAFGEDFNRIVLRESFGGGPYDSARRSTESIETSTWAEILGDSLTRRMVAEYGLMQLSAWRKIVSSVVPVNDFRTQRIDRMGGYGTLPGVAQSGVYQPLTSPTDEEVTYAITKRGGTEDLTLESVANDDLRAVQRIPTKLGRAAAQTLFRFVFDFLATNPNVYDATALFAAGHANTDAGAALTAATLGTGRRKMRKQTAYGDSSEVLGFTPATLVVPSDLEDIAFKLSRSAVAITSAEDATTPNIHQGLELIVVDYFSDTNDWFLGADTQLCPTIEIGFYQGREEPELFVQDDPRVGAVFTADKITWKIRHIYSGAVLDYRGFYRGQG